MKNQPTRSSEIDKLRHIARACVDVHDTLENDGHYTFDAPARVFLRKTSDCLQQLAETLDKARVPQPVPTDILEARAEGRAEAVAILANMSAEEGLDDYTESYSIGDTGDYGSSWNIDKLHELFHTKDTVWSLQADAEGEYYHQLGLREAAESMYATAAVPWKALHDLVRALTQDSQRHTLDEALAASKVAVDGQDACLTFDAWLDDCVADGGTTVRHVILKRAPLDAARDGWAAALASKMKGEPIADQPARAAIDGAIAYGRMGVNPPPAGHWLTEYWSVGQQLAELGKTSAWDNVTPVENRQKDNDSAARNGDGMATSIPEGILDALRFYANGSHFTMHDSSAWDTVSGEPPNFYEDESNTATVEDGSIAKLALRGKFFPDAEYKEPMVEGEVFAAAPEALRAAGVALSDAEIHSLWILSPPDEDGNDYVPFARAIESRILAKCKGEQS